MRWVFAGTIALLISTGSSHAGVVTLNFNENALSPRTVTFNGPFDQSAYIPINVELLTNIHLSSIPDMHDQIGFDVFVTISAGTTSFLDACGSSNPGPCRGSTPPLSNYNYLTSGATSVGVDVAFSHTVSGPDAGQLDLLFGDQSNSGNHHRSRRIQRYRRRPRSHHVGHAVDWLRGGLALGIPGASAIPPIPHQSE